MKNLVAGIDVSKEKLDLCLLLEGKVVSEWEVENSTPAIVSTLQGVLQRHSREASEVLICAEYTGQYGYPLGCACAELHIDLWMENAAQIKHSSGLTRGKNDPLDARKIAAYAARFQDKVRLFSLPEKKLATLKQLVSERDMYVCHKSKYQGQLTDQQRFMSQEDYSSKSQRMLTLLQGLEEAIAAIEEKIREVIDSDETLHRQHALLLSVDGVGEKTAVKMIVSTNAFRDFENARQFCCHAGVAPFKYDSGSSVRSRSKVSQRADKSIKALLHMAALSVATRTKGELHDYYLRKVAEGKNKMLVLNAIRAKLVMRMFAVIKNNNFYEKNHTFCLQKS
jgi:transposase